MLKVLPASKNSAQEDGGIDGRHFRVPHSFAGREAGEVIEKSSMRGQFFPQEAQAVHNPLAGFSHGNIAALLPDADRRQPEACSCDTSHEAVIVRSHIASISHHPGLRIGLFPEIKKIRLLQFFQQIVIGLRKVGWNGRARRLKVLLRRRGQKRTKASGKRQTYPQAGHLFQQIPSRYIFVLGMVLVFQAH